MPFFWLVCRLEPQALQCPKAFGAEVEHTDTSDRPYQEKLFDVAVDFTYSEAGDYMLTADAETLDDLC